MSLYINDVLLCLIFAAFIKLLMPSSKMTKLLNLFLGLVMVVVLSRPALAFMDDGLQGLTGLFDSKAGMIETDPAYYEEMRYDMLTGLFTDQVSKQIAELVKPYGYLLKDARVTLNSEQNGIGQLSLTLGDTEAVTDTEEQQAKAGLIRIEEVKVGRIDEIMGLGEAAVDTGSNGSDVQAIKKAISDFYGVEERHIHITVTATRQSANWRH